MFVFKVVLAVESIIHCHRFRYTHTLAHEYIKLYIVVSSPDEAVPSREPGGIQQNPDGMSSQEEADSQPDRAMYSDWLGKGL